MREEIKSGQAEMRSTFCVMRYELTETIQHEMKAIIQPIVSELDETTACNEATDWTQSRNDAVHRGASGDPQGRGRSDAGRRTEEAA
jgi:hypothetical protein